MENPAWLKPERGLWQKGKRSSHGQNLKGDCVKKWEDKIRCSQNLKRDCSKNGYSQHSQNPRGGYGKNDKIKFIQHRKKTMAKMDKSKEKDIRKKSSNIWREWREKRFVFVKKGETYTNKVNQFERDILRFSSLFWYWKSTVLLC